MRKVIFNIYLFASFMFISCDGIFDSNDCVEEYAGIQEVIAPDTVNVNESLNIEIIFWLSCQSFERVEESNTDSTINIDIVVCDLLANRPDLACTNGIVIDSLIKEINFTKKGKFKIIVNDSSKIKEIEVI